VKGDPIDGTGTPADPRVARTRAAVLNAGIDLLAERGYPGFTIDAIVARTGIAKTTIYRHWPSRDSLLTAVQFAVAGRNDRKCKDLRSPMRLATFC
jgi:AcrR family transcriptional regulator